jgi:hypothetical protein
MFATQGGDNVGSCLMFEVSLTQLSQLLDAERTRLAYERQEAAASYSEAQLFIKLAREQRAQARTWNCCIPNSFHLANDKTGGPMGLFSRTG